MGAIKQFGMLRRRYWLVWIVTQAKAIRLNDLIVIKGTEQVYLRISWAKGIEVITEIAVFLAKREVVENLKLTL